MEARDRFERILNSFPILDLSMDRCSGEPTGRAASMRQGVGFHGGRGGSSDGRPIVETSATTTSNSGSLEDFGVRKTSLYTNTVESPTLSFFPYSQATFISVGDGLIQPHEIRAQPYNKVVLLRLCLVISSENYLTH